MLPIRALRLPVGGSCSMCSLMRSHVRTYARSCFKTKPRKIRAENKVSPLKQKIAADVRDIFTNDAVAVVHYGDLNTQAWTSLRLKLAEVGMKVQVIPTKVATRALDGSPVQNITLLFKGSTALVYGRFEHTSSLLSCIKSEQKLVLLGGKVLDQLFTPRGLAEVAKLPSLEALHQELAALLLLPQTQHLMLLQSVPSSLSNSLSLHVSFRSSSGSDTVLAEEP